MSETAMNYLTRLRNVQTMSGTYAMHIQNQNGTWKILPQIGISIKPYDILRVFPDSRWVLVRKRGNRLQKQENLEKPTLYLIDMINDCLLAVAENGIGRVRYDENSGTIYINTLSTNRKIQTRTWAVKDEEWAVTDVIPETALPIQIDGPSIAPIETIEFQQPKGHEKLQWHEMKPNTLKNYYYDLRQNLPPELNQTLAKVFPKNYDPITQTFIGLKNKGKSQTPGTRKPLNEMSDKALYSYYYRLKSCKCDIPDDLSKLLQEKFKSFDPANGFVQTKYIERVDDINFIRSAKDDVLMRLYKSLKRTDSIPEKFNKELAKRFDNYDPEKMEFRAKEKPTKNLSFQHFISRPKEFNMPVLTLSKKLLRTSPAGQHYDVFVNGVMILHDHINTEINVCLDGQYACIFGITLNAADIPEKPIYQIFDHNVQPKTFPHLVQYTNQQIYIKRIFETKNHLQLEISNQTQIILNRRQDIIRRYALEMEK